MSDERNDQRVEADPTFDRLMQYLKRTRGVDFSAYKAGSLMRRIGKRMETVGLTDFGDYTDYLEVHPEEFPLLFNHILINVTAFFRDEAAWEHLRTKVVPEIVAGKAGDDPIRIWSAGCASGQEPYGLAIAFTELMGPAAFQQRVKIYASDMDEEALAQARQGAYPAKELETMSAPLREKYFELTGNRYAFRADLRRSLIFGRHDLVSDPPMSRLDLLLCRNTLMYFNAETQNRILARFHFALNDPGYLFLGKAEMLLTHGNLFVPVELRHRLFRKVSKASLSDRLDVLGQMSRDDGGQRHTRHLRVRDLAQEVAPMPQVVVDAEGDVVFANERARGIFGIEARDVGRPFRDLEVSYRPVELRSVIEQSYRERRTLVQLGVERRHEGGVQHYDIEVTPLMDDGGTTVGASVTFRDVSRAHVLQGELQRSTQELETAYEELQSTNEELETTNEELQSTVEELETTNEELQSTNEELETMNEELQSTNEELQTVNGELRDRTEDLNRANLFQHSILGGIRAGVAVLNEELAVVSWNHRMEDLWGLREAEVQGRTLMSLDMGLPVDRLVEPIQACLRGTGDKQTTALEAINRRGKKIACRVLCSPLAKDGAPPHGVILLIEDGAIPSA